MNAAIYSSILDAEPELAPLVVRFVASLPTVSSELSLAWQQHDWRRLRHAAHILKGTSRSLGFPQLMQIADNIETNAIYHTGAEMEQLLAELETTLARVVVNT